MSWQNAWGTVKLKDAKACALYYEVSNVGKTIESSKKRVIWRLKVEEGREFEIALTHSLASGKKVLRVDGIVKYTTQALSFGDWDYVFNLPGGHVVHCIIKPSVELNDMYDLIIDNISFRRLPDRLDPNRNSKAPANSGSNRSLPTSSSSYSSSRGPPTYRYSAGDGGKTSNSRGSSGPSSREGSFTPWECTRCTLVNDKVLAPVCEACGHPKPAYISPVARQHAIAATASASVERREPAAVENTDRRRSSRAESDSGAFNPFGVEAASAFGASPSPSFGSFDAFGQQQTQPKQPDDISSMLSGLDFTAPAPPQQQFAPAPVNNMFEAPVSPNPAEDTNARTASGDLWDSNIVDLDLNGEKKKPQVKTMKSYQTLEQARLQAPKDKVPVLPTPPPMMATTAMVPAGAYYATTPTNGMMYPQQQPQYGMPAPAMGYAMAHPSAAVHAYGGMMQQPPMQQHQQFMTNVAPQQPRPNAFSADPFATLS